MNIYHGKCIQLILIEKWCILNFIISDGTGNPSPPVSSSRAGKGKHSQSI